MPDQPNVLLIVADQLAAQFLPAYGHGLVKTPHIDRLAAGGVVFDRFYSPSPLCAPARATLMSGLLSSASGVYDNAAEFRSSIPTFAHYMRLAGYRTCLSGKMHFVGPDQLHGFEERLTTDIYPADFGWTPDWTRPDERVDWWYHNMSSVKEAGTAEITSQLEYDDEVVFQAERKLFDHARDGERRPFCLCVSFTHPHDPYVARPPFWALYDDAAIDPPATPPIPRSRMDPHSRRLHDMSDMTRAPVSAEDVRRSRRGYYANVSYVDSLIGRLLRTLAATGRAGETIVILTSDHGDFLGERGLWYKMSFLDPAARVPFIVHAPGRFTPGRVKAAASLADIAPTLVDLAGARPATPMDGGSLRPLLEGADDPDRLILGDYCAEGVSHPLRMARRGRWKLILCEGDPPLLHDCDADPRELINRAEDPDCAAVFAELKGAIEARFAGKDTRAEVLASQRARLAVFKALTSGRHFPWDYQPLRLASEQYTRNTRADVAATDAASRFPPFG